MRCWLSTLLLWGCAETNAPRGVEEPARSRTSPPLVMDCSESHTWATVGAPFMLTWCTPCHGPALAEEDRQGAPMGLDFDTHAKAVAMQARIQARVLDSAGVSPMPPMGGPSDAELEALQAWLDCGMPE